MCEERKERAPLNPEEEYTMPQVVREDVLSVYDDNVTYEHRPVNRIVPKVAMYRRFRRDPKRPPQWTACDIVGVRVFRDAATQDLKFELEVWAPVIFKNRTLTTMPQLVLNDKLEDANRIVAGEAYGRLDHAGVVWTLVCESNAQQTRLALAMQEQLFRVQHALVHTRLLREGHIHRTCPECAGVGTATVYRIIRKRIRAGDPNHIRKPGDQELTDIDEKLLIELAKKVGEEPEVIAQIAANASEHIKRLRVEAAMAAAVPLRL